MSHENVEVVKAKNALRAWLEDWTDMFDEFQMELLELIDAGDDTVVAIERFGGRAKRSGVETHQTIGDVFTIRDGRISCGREYATVEQALEAAGVRE
jgi:ketosteroid isomerase-like protein